MRNDRKSSEVMADIRAVASAVIPQEGRVILFGSRARGDYHYDSDWDLLILLPQHMMGGTAHDDYSYPFWELGWKRNVMIHPVVYSFSEWQSRAHTPFYKNIQKEGIVLC